MNIEKGMSYAIIPARSGSKGVINKNISLLGGHPLIAFSIMAGLKSKKIKRVFVSTDTENYANIAKKYGAEVPFLRPAEISDDRSTDIEFFKHAIDWLNKNESKVPEFFVHLRPTTPLRSVAVIDSAVSLFVGSNFTSLRSVHRMSESSYKSFEVEDKLLLTAFNRDRDIDKSGFGRQQYPVTFNANGYVDVVRSEFIIENQKLHGDNVFAFETEVTHELDEPSDFDFLQFVVSKNKAIFKDLFDNDS